MTCVLGGQKSLPPCWGMISHYDCSGITLNVNATAGRGPGRLRVMLLASGFPIKTILINQSLRDGSNLKPWFSLSKIAGHHPVTSDGARLSCPFTISSLWPPRTREGQSPRESHLKLIWPLEISSHPEPDCHIGKKKYSLTFFLFKLQKVPAQEQELHCHSVLPGAG